MDRSEDKTQDREAGRILSETEGRRPGDTPNPSVTTSSQASYRLLRRKRQSSLTALLLLSPHDPLRWARAGAQLVDGNHENFDRFNEFPVHHWHGGKIHYIRPHVIHLMRGQVFEIGGITFFTMGGASSHDIQDGILDPASPDFEREYWFKRRTR